MNKYPVKQSAADLEKAPGGEVPAAQPSGGFSFRYAYREVSLSGGKTRIRSREQRFEDGKFQSEEFDATTDGAMYHEAVKATQALVTNQVTSLVKLFATFLPLSRSK